LKLRNPPKFIKGKEYEVGGTDYCDALDFILSISVEYGQLWNAAKIIDGAAVEELLKHTETLGNMRKEKK